MTYAICDFVKGLLPGLKKETILEDLRISIDTIDRIVVPMLDKITAVTVDKFVSEENLELEKAFNRTYRGKITVQPNLLLTLKDCMPNIRQNAYYVESRLQEILEATIVPDGITSRKAAMIRAAKQISFIADMTMDLMNVVLVNESLAKNADLVDNMEVSKSAHIRVEKNIVRYAYAVTDFSKGPGQYQNLYAKLKDVYVGGANAKNVQVAAKEMEIDPFESRLVQNVAYNPIYHFRIAVAQWQARRYHASKEKKKVLELRVLQLRSEYENKQDPRVLKEINYTQSRIDKLDREIHETDTDLGME